MHAAMASEALDSARETTAELWSPEQLLIITVYSLYLGTLLKYKFSISMVMLMLSWLPMFW